MSLIKIMITIVYIGITINFTTPTLTNNILNFSNSIRCPLVLNHSYPSIRYKH